MRCRCSPTAPRSCSSDRTAIARGSRAIPPYAGSKGFIRAFARNAGTDPALLARGIRVNVVAPGPIATSMTAAATSDRQANAYVTGALVPMHRWGRPDEVAEAILFLTSDASSSRPGRRSRSTGAWLMRDNRDLPSDHVLHAKRMAIVGAGPAGLTLARLLQMRGVTVTVFERDASPDVRGRGGSLDLHEDWGQLALEAAGLGAAFVRHARPEGQSSRVLDRHGVVVAEMHPAGEGRSRPEIDRGTLRSVLLQSLEPKTISWDRRLVDACRTDRRTVRLRFENADVEADLIIGVGRGRHRRTADEGLVVP